MTEEKIEKLAEKLHNIWSKSFECIKERTYAYYTNEISRETGGVYYDYHDEEEEEKYFRNIELFERNLEQSKLPYSKLYECDKEENRKLARKLLRLIEEED
jgi:hypothetical protein